MAGLPPSDVDLRIAARVRAARQASGILQRDACTAVGVSPAQLQKYEVGLNRLTGGMIQALARLYGVPVASFFDPVASAAHADLVGAEAALLAAAEAYVAARQAASAASN